MNNLPMTKFARGSLRLLLGAIVLAQVSCGSSGGPLGVRCRSGRRIFEYFTFLVGNNTVNFRVKGYR